MELPPVADRLERALVAALLAGVLAAAWAESRSPLAQAVRAGRPRLFWLALAGGENRPPRLSLGLYHPDRRALDLVSVPGTLKTGERRTLDQAYAQALKEDGGEAEAAQQAAEEAYETLAPLLPAAADLPPPAFLYAESPERGLPVLDARDWLEARSRGLGFWRHLPSSLFAPARLRLFAELKRLGPEGLRPAELPEENLRRELFGRLWAEQAPAPAGPVLVEVLNATDLKGIASQATKILRLAGADVVSVGNAPAAEAGTGTVIYDRAGRIESAFWVRERLDCPSARVVTRLSEKRLSDATVVLGADCGFREE